MSELWYGYPCEKFEFEGREAIVVAPKAESCGRLALKTEYWGAFPEALELPLLAKGFHVCYVKNDTRWGTEPDLARQGRLVRFVAEKYGLDPRCVPVGMSCGGLIAIKFAAMFPELVSCIYADAPVVNYMSCPCGFGVGYALGQERDFSEILGALGMENISQLLSYRDMPLDKIPVLMANKIPMVLVCGDADNTVPYCENGLLLEQAYRKAGVDFEVYLKPGGDHHPHGLPDAAPLVDFVLRHP